MEQVIDFFKKLLDITDWPPRWHCGKWSGFHGWLYIVSDLLIWAAYFAIPVVIIKYISKKQHLKFLKLYVFFAMFILSCGTTHFLDAIAFWWPAYRLSALVRFITATISWITVYHLIKILPLAFSLKTKSEMQVEIEHRVQVENELRNLNASLEQRILERTAKLQESLREISAYKYALDASAIVAITNQKGIITHVNENFCKISKYSREELIGEDHRIINSSFHSKEFIKNLWKTIAVGKIWKGELKNRARDGSYYWVDTTIVPFLNEEGKPYQYVAIRADITERKQAEEKIFILNQELKRSEKQFRAMIEYSKDAFIVINEAGLSFVSKGITEVLGYTEEEYSKLVPEAIVHPDDLPLRWNELSKPGDMINLQFRCLHKNGTWQWLEGTAVNLNDIDGINGIVFTLRNITRRKDDEKFLMESEKIYKTIAAGIPGSMILLMDANYKYMVAEGDMLPKIGYTPKLIVGENAKDILPAKIYEELLPNFRRVFSGEYFIVEQHRAEHDFVTRYIPLKTETNDVYAALIVAIDVSELKTAQRAITDLNMALEQRVIERTHQLEIANKDMEAFSYSVSHDLRAPLRAVSGYTKMLEEDYNHLLGDNGKRLLSIIQQNALRMGALIDDLLEFSRLGRKEVQKTIVDVNTLVRTVVDELTTGDNYHANIHIGDLMPVNADSSLIKQVFINFISNALKYSSKKEQPEIKISASSGRNEITYSVSDNGSGFDMQYQQKLFKVFERLHGQEEFEGTGVGLAIAKRIIDKHKGSIWATGMPGHGATFFFSLPIDGKRKF